MLKPLAGIALLFTLSSAAAQAPSAPSESQATGKVVRVIGARPTPTGESARVFAAKRRMLGGSLAQKCWLDSVYFSQDDDDEAYLVQLEEGQEPGDIAIAVEPMRSPGLEKFNGNAPFGDASNMVDASMLTGTASRHVLGPCGSSDRRFAAGREHILRKDRSFADALAHLDAGQYEQAAAKLDVAYDKIGYPEAAVLLAKLSLHGLGVARSTDKALYWLDRVAGARFDPSRDKLRFNPRYPKAATGMIDAALLLARIHLQGIGGVRQDPVEARKWYRKAAEFGYAPALNTLGLAAQAGVGGPKDSKAARAYFQEAAEAGHVPAQYNLALLYYTGGDGLVRDYRLAGAWFAQAAKGGDDRSLYAMAGMYDRGEGVPVNQGRAIVYYKAAALKLVPEAQSALASYFYTGEQVPKNLATARQLYTEAATRGEPEAMFNLAVMLANGEGGGKDLGMAYAWFSLARASGLDRAGAALAAIDGTLSAQDRARADAVLMPAAGR